MIELVAAPHRLVGAEDRGAGKREVANPAERLMTHELVRVAKAFRIEQPVVRHHHCVLERRTERIARAPELRHVLHEAESAGPRYFAAEARRLDVHRDRLLADQRVSEVDGDVDAEAALIRRQFAVGLALLHADWL